MVLRVPASGRVPTSTLQDTYVDILVLPAHNFVYGLDVY